MRARARVGALVVGAQLVGSQLVGVQLVGVQLGAMLSAAAAAAAGETGSPTTAVAGSDTKPTAAPSTKAPPKPPSNGEINALVKAAAEPDPRRLEAMIRGSSPINGRTLRDETPLQAAAGAGLIANVFALLSRGAQTDALAARGTTALGWAARNGHGPVARMLLDAGANPDAAADPARAPITLAARSDHQAIVSLLVERGSKVFEKPELAGAVLVALGEANSVSLAGELIPRMAGLIATSAPFREAAADAIVGSNAVMAQAILRHLGVAAELRDFQTALLLTAARRKRPDIAAAAVAQGADANARHPVLGTPLAAAVAMSDADTVAILLSAGVDWKSSSVEQPKIEQIAGERLNDLRVAELLASIGSPDVRDEHGQTPLLRLAQRGDVGGVSTLLRYHASPAATAKRWPGDDGWTAMMAAAANGHTAVVERLLAAGAPVDQRNGSGRTALGFAAFYGRAQTVVVLLDAGADPDAADRIGLTPRRLAQAGGEAVTIDLLRDRDAARR